MKPTPLAEAARRLGGELHGVEGAAPEVTGWSFDSGEVAPGDLFAAVRGHRVDGHDYVEAALARGAVAAVTERSGPGPRIVVDELVAALARYGASYRAEFEAPVLGITGSVGKTTVKELCAAALSPLGPILKTQGNRNTEYSGPLLWAEAGREHRAAVVEMGMRGFGHIAHLAEIARPTFGLVTNVGTAHLAKVGDRAGIARAKSELLRALPAGGAAILWAEDDFLDALRAASPAPSRTFGRSPEADSRIEAYEPLGWTGAAVSGSTFGRRWSARLPAAGRHIALAAAAAMLAAALLDVDLDAASAALAGAELPPLRMEVRRVGGATILLDAYNASPASVKAAVETLAEGETDGRRFAVIGEMRDLGPASEEGHREVGRAIARAGLDGVLLFGEDAEPVADELERAGAATRVERAGTIAEVEAYLGRLQPGDVALVKGSRSLELERAVPR